MSDPNGVGPDLHEKPTVTSTGESVLTSIDGVIVRTPVTHVDHRGALFEIFNGDPELWPGERVEPVTTLYNIWTHEALPILPGDGHEIDGRFRNFLRDHFTNQATHMDVRLIDVETRPVDRVGHGKAMREDVHDRLHDRSP